MASIFPYALLPSCKSPAGSIVFFNLTRNRVPTEKSQRELTTITVMWQTLKPVKAKEIVGCLEFL